MFGAQLQQPQPQAGGSKVGTLFGSTTAPPGGLQTASTQASSQPAAAASLFGPTATQPLATSNAPSNNHATGLFGGAQPNQSSNALFGGAQQNQNASVHASNSAFAGLAQPQNANANASLFGASRPTQLQPAPPAAQQPSLFGGVMQPASSISLAAQQQMAHQQMQQTLPNLRQSAQAPLPMAPSGPRDKPVAQQLHMLHSKWLPDQPECVFQTYLYNAVPPEQAPFYGPQPGEDEKKWEQALADKPHPGAVPILIRGFGQLAQRVDLQSYAVDAMRIRLHEINSCLSLMKNAHELDVASSLLAARQKHTVFTQRTLALAAKVQILRNRGYAMDPAEEELKRKLLELEKKLFDPIIGGRQEEIWARMSGVKERVRLLEAETERLGVAAQGSNTELTAEEQKQVEDLLHGYEKQLDHLRNWLGETKKEWEAWESGVPLGMHGR